MNLGVNIDHIATVRQARGTISPDPIMAAAIAEMAGAEGITIHLREDRRHIQDRDLLLLTQTIATKINLEMAVAPEIVEIALKTKPACACLVPERRQELTTEGGLNVIQNFENIKNVTNSLQSNGTVVSLFIDPEQDQIEAAANAGAKFIELHTGCFADAIDQKKQLLELDKLIDGAQFANKIGLQVNAGHGLNYHNVHLMHKVPFLEELNIGHSIIARAILVGLDQAVRDMVALVKAS